MVLGGLTTVALLPLGRDAALARLGLTIIGAYFASTVLHELGHAVATWAQGLKVARISFGAGRPLWTLTLGGVPVDLCSFPVSGYVRHEVGTRTQDVLITLGGPLANLALLAGGWASAFGAGGPSRLSLEQVGPAHALVVVNSLILLYNAIPLELPGGDVAQGERPSAVANDGLALLRRLRG